MTVIDPSEAEGYEFDVAVSFAGEDREYVADVVEQLKAADISVFYDDDYMADAWGEDLVEYFDNIYRFKARYAIIFVSHFYAEKVWTRHERRSALARALEQRAAYILPVHLDDTALEGVRPTIGYLDARRVGINGVVDAALTKVAGARTGVTTVDRVPRSEVERQIILIQRPSGWEFLYFAGQLLYERDAVENLYRDHEIRYAARTGESLRSEDMPRYLKSASDDAIRITETMNRVMAPEAPERAFGPVGHPVTPTVWPI